jgi:hypothetical protein
MAATQTPPLPGSTLLRWKYITEFIFTGKAVTS